jgi:hypothetical protein
MNHSVADRIKDRLEKFTSERETMTFDPEATPPLETKPIRLIRRSHEDVAETMFRDLMGYMIRLALVITTRMIEPDWDPSKPGCSRLLRMAGECANFLAYYLDDPQLTKDERARVTELYLELSRYGP